MEMFCMSIFFVDFSGYSFTNFQRVFYLDTYQPLYRGTIPFKIILAFPGKSTTMKGEKNAEKES